MAQRARFVAFFALGCFACSAPAWTSDANTGVTAFSFDYSVMASQGDEGCMTNVPATQSDCSAACAAFIVYPSETDQAAGCTDPGTSQPDPQTLARLAARYPNEVACAYRQLVGGASSSVAQAAACTNALPDYSGVSCKDSSEAGWCYAVGPAITGGCPVGIQFGAGGPPVGTRLHFDCVE